MIESYEKTTVNEMPVQREVSSLWFQLPRLWFHIQPKGLKLQLGLQKLTGRLRGKICYKKNLDDYHELLDPCTVLDILDSKYMVVV